MAAAPSLPQTAPPDREGQLVTFYLDDEEFGFDIMSVQEIIRQPPLSRIPMAPEYVDGITNLRGTILPVIDTRSRFGMARREDTDSTRILVVDVDGVKTGLRVDRVRQVTRIQATHVEPPPPTVRSSGSAAYLHGLVKLDGGKRIIMALSAAAVSKVEASESRVAALPPPAPYGTQADQGPKVRNQGDAHPSTLLLVSFQLGQEEFAFPMECVREILRVERPSEVPDSPDSLLGLLSVRGNILPVIDLRTLLGLEKLAAELQSTTARLRRDYEQWLATTEETLRHASAPLPCPAAPESLRAWLHGFTTSSEVLMDVLSLMRTANEKVLRGGLHLVESNDTSVRQRQFDREMKPAAAEVLHHLAELDAKLADHIREDQRLVVVQGAGELLAFVVDKVREVLRLPTDVLYPPPRLGGTQINRNLRGMAKLRGGERLILLLDIEYLLDGEGLDAARRAVASAKTLANGTQPEPAHQTAAVPHASQEGPLDKMGQRAEERQFVIFRLDDGEYGIPISEIREIDRASKTTRIPTSADYVDGITNLRGEVIPVVNARKRLKLPERQADERTRVIMIDLHGEKTGLVVDSVREVLKVALCNIVAPPASVCPPVDPQYLAGIGQVDGGRRTIVLLDAAKLIHIER